MKSYRSTVLFLSFLFLLVSAANSQESHKRFMTRHSPDLSRWHDSIMAVRVPLLGLPERYRNRSLPAMVDNSKKKYWPGILDQFLFASCQQVCGVGYVFNYEINRLRNTPGWYWENSYPAHYTWNFMNQGDWGTGVNFLESFEVIRQQGNMASIDYGPDTATEAIGWISGYEKYYRGMFNHIRQVNAIMTNSTDGINTLKNYLFDHLDGSASGGIGCFTTDAAALYGMAVIPAGLPEAGKHIIPAWAINPEHGMTVVGYNDSIRYDVNQDGKFTNDIDINGDGIVDARDWEIGAFKIANSYGNWWSDTGYVYAMYRAFALNFQEGGVWNNRVYVMDADTGYRPLLTLRVNLSYNLRDRIRILAGVSSDTTNQMPEHVISFPIFNFQGGEHVMQGWDTIPDAKSIEFGLDVTELLNMVPAGMPARYFLAVEERDPDHSGNGTIQKASFISYQDGVHEFPCSRENVDIGDNAVTVVSAVATAGKPIVQITTNSLPPVVASQPFQVQLTAAGGRPPYNWSFIENYARQPVTAAMPLITGTSLVSGIKNFTAVALPFSFPFYGKNYDSIYVNFNGFITFEPLYLPGWFTTDEVSMLKMTASVAPAFSQNFSYQVGKNDGIFLQAEPTQVVIRWKASVTGHITGSSNDFALVLYPGGRYEFRYGTMDNEGYLQTCYTGISKGDNLNYDIQTSWNPYDLSGKSFRFIPPELPSGLALSAAGLLSVTQADSTVLYDLNIRVTDAGKISDSKILELSGGLEIDCQIAGADDNRLQIGKTEHMMLSITNTGLQPVQNLVLRIMPADTLLNITDSVFTVALLQPAQTLTIPAAFSFGLKKPLPAGFPVLITLQAQSGMRFWKKELEFEVAAPTLVVQPPQLKDGFNNLLDPGEVADLVVSVENSGKLQADKLVLKLVSSDTLISILSSPSIAIDKVEPLSLKELSYQVRASRYTVPGHEAAMELLLNDSTGVIQSLDFQLKVGKKQVALISLSASKASMLAMVAAFDSLRVGYDTITSAGALPSGYDQYSCVFLLLGTGSSGWHTLSVAEATPFANYLQKKGNLYMEGYLTWYYSRATPLHPFFKYTTSKIPDYTYQFARGVPGTFSDSMSFAYASPLNHATFSFEPVPPAYSTLVNADSVPKNFEIVYDGSDYKTIGTFLGFSDLAGNSYPSTQGNLMRHYLEFFGLNITGPYPFFHAAATSVCKGGNLDFTDDSFDHITSWNWEFPGGTPASSTLPDPVVRYDSVGRYDVKLTVSDGSSAKSIIKKSYITVDRCSGNEKLSTRPWFRVYPNPASDRVTVEFSGEIKGIFRIALFDFTGRTMIYRESFPGAGGGTFTMDVAGFKKGLYLVRIQAGTSVSTQKLIIN